MLKVLAFGENAVVVLSLVCASWAFGQNKQYSLLPKLDTPGREVTFGFDLFTLTETDIKDTKAAVEFYLKEMGKNVRVHADTFANVQSMIFEDVQTMADQVRSGILDVGHVSPLHFLQMDIEPITDIAYGAAMRGSVFRRYLLITHADSLIDSIEKLENKSVAVMRTNDMGLLYLDVELLKRGKKETGDFFSAIVEKRLFSQAIFSVFFGQTDACLTTEAAFGTAVELNPQLGKKLRTILVSPELLNMVAFFRKGLDENSKQTTINEITKSTETEYGKTVLLLFHIDGLEPIKSSDLDSLKELLREYRKLGGQNPSFLLPINSN